MGPTGELIRRLGEVAGKSVPASAPLPFGAPDFGTKRENLAEGGSGASCCEAGDGGGVTGEMSPNCAEAASESFRVRSPLGLRWPRPPWFRAFAGYAPPAGFADSRSG